MSKPSFAKTVALRGDPSCREALVRIAREAFRQIAANRAVVLESDAPEGAHQLRIGLTRLRAALKLFRPLLVEAQAGRIARHARNLARAVGALRDADVLIEDIVAPASAVPGADAAAMEALTAALARHRLAMRDAARDALRSADWSALMLELTLWPGTLGDVRALDRPVSDYAGRALDRSWRKVARMGRRIDDLDAEQRHALRRALKRQRYGAEFLQTLYPARKVRPFTRRLKTLQDIFGYMNDVEMARGLDAIALRHGVEPAGLQAAGFTLGWHSARLGAALDHAGAYWRALKRETKFWR